MITRLPITWFLRRSGSAINLTLTNPNSYSIPVVSLTVSVASVTTHNTILACTTADFATTAYSGAGFTLPPGTSILSGLGIPQSQWPTLRMLNTAYNQDGCKGATLSLTYTGTAHP